jgi:hypothetical protein
LKRHSNGARQRVYAKRAEVTVPSLVNWEMSWQENPQRDVQTKLLQLDIRLGLPGILKAFSGKLLTLP